MAVFACLSTSSFYLWTMLIVYLYPQTHAFKQVQCLPFYQLYNQPVLTAEINQNEINLSVSLKTSYVSLATVRGGI